MENPEEVLQLLERFTKLKQKEIPRELDDYLSFVARTGDTVYRWAIVKHLFREKLVHVITDFHDNTPSIADLPQCPNVDPFNYERMKRILLERLDAFNSAPFTVQRICELLTEPRKQYTRIDKYMRAVEKNILVVSTQEPGRRRSESENGDSLDSIVNGDLEVNVDIEMDNEAFGIDSTGGEIVPSSAAAAAAVVTAEPVTPSALEEEQTSGVTESEVAKEEAEVAAATEAATTDKEGEAKEGPVDEPVAVNPVAEGGQVEADIPNDDPKPVEDISEPTELLVAQPVEEPSTVAEDLPVPEVQPLDPTEPDSINDLLPAKESHDTVKDLPDGSESVESKAETASEPNDDGQPAPKLAKLSDEAVVEPVAQAKPSSAVPDSLEAKEDDVSSGSTTDSGGSSVSVESEPTISTTTSSTDSSTTVEPESESTDRLAQEEQQPIPTADPVSEPEKEQPIPCEPISDAVPTPEILPPTVEQQQPATPVEVEPTSVKESIDEPVVGVEMETAAVAPVPAAVLVPENVMATDEEDTIQSPVDAVVPMAADAPEATKPDDNAMDVDESSVEPMEDQ